MYVEGIDQGSPHIACNIHVLHIYIEVIVSSLISSLRNGFMRKTTQVLIRVLMSIRVFLLSLQQQ